MMQTAVQNNLNELVGLLRQLSDLQYTAAIPELSDATIGEHTRHIIEMFQCLLNPDANNIVNYDGRQRDLILQRDVSTAMLSLTEICNQLPSKDTNITLMQCIDGVEYRIDSTTNRELLYNLEHAIHHQALIKVALRNFENISVDADFGVARSTIEFRNRCAQ